MSPSPPRAAQVGRNAVVIAVASTVVRLSGLVREMVFAAFFGAGVATDAYNAAFRAAQFFRELLAEGSLANVYVPVFADTEQKEGLAAAWRLANAFLGALLVVLGLITLLTFAFAEAWVYVVAAGFAEEPAKFQLAATLTRVLAPFLATVSLASLFMGMLNVRGRFFLPAVAPATFNVAVIAACFLKAPWERATGLDGIMLVALASVIGGAGQFLVQLPALRREGFRLRPRLERHPALWRMLVFMVPALIGIMTVQFNLLVESQLASRFGDGPVSYLMYGFRLVQLPNSIVAGAVGTAALAGLSALAAAGRREQLRGALAEAITLNSFLILPAGVGLYLLAEPLITLMYQRGAFTPEASAATADVLKMYAIAVWGIGMHRVLLPSYYAIGRPWFAMIAAVISMAAKLPVALLMVYTLGLGFSGLPLSHAVLVTGEVAVLLAGLGPRVGRLPARIWADHLRIAVASALMGGMLWLLQPWSHGLMLFPVVAGAGLVYLTAAHLLGLEAPRQVLRRLRPGPAARGLPPTIDPESAAALMALQGAALGSVRLDEGTLSLETSAGCFRVRAQAGVLSLERTGPGTGSGPALDVVAVLRVQPPPPLLHGLRLGGRAFRAEGDRVVEGAAEGPMIPVAEVKGR
ncbi:MAG: murein biosynthesis integral membrane protein MurJ [Pseudomonadota bacterium]